MQPTATTTPTNSLPLPSSMPGMPSFLTTFVKSAALSGGLNLGIYCIVVQLLKRPKDSLPPVQPFVLFGALQGGLHVVVNKIYEVGFGLLGKDNANEEAGQTVGSGLRQRCWKVINYVDGISNKIDAFVSAKLGIRTAKELNIHYANVQVMVELGKTVEQTQLVHEGQSFKALSPLEIIRFVFWKSLIGTAKGMVVTHLSNRALEKIGYEPIGAKGQLGPEALIAEKGIHIRFACNFIFDFVMKTGLAILMHEKNLETNQKSAGLKRQCAQLVSACQAKNLQQFLSDGRLDPNLKSVLEQYQNKELLGLVRLNSRLQDLLATKPVLQEFLQKNGFLEGGVEQNPTLQEFLLTHSAVQESLAQNQELQNILIGRES